MTEDAHLGDVHELILRTQLLDGCLMVGQRIVAQVLVTEIVVPLRATGVTASLTYTNNDETSLSQAVGTRRHTVVSPIRTFGLWAWIDIIDNRINHRTIKVVRLIHSAIKIGDTISCLYLEEFGELIAGSKQLTEICFLQRHQFAALIVQQVDGRFAIYTRIVVNNISMLLVHE